MTRTLLLALTLLLGAGLARADVEVEGEFFDAGDGDLSGFSTKRRTGPVAPRATWGEALQAAPFKLGERDLLPELARRFRMKLSAEVRQRELRPLRVLSPRPFEGTVEVRPGGGALVDGEERPLVGETWQWLYADELRGQRVRVAGWLGKNLRTGVEELLVVKVEATVGAGATLRRDRRTRTAYAGDRLWIQGAGRADGPVPLLQVSEPDAHPLEVSPRPWWVRVTDVRLIQLPVQPPRVGIIDRLLGG